MIKRAIFLYLSILTFLCAMGHSQAGSVEFLSARKRASVMRNFASEKTLQLLEQSVLAHAFLHYFAEPIVAHNCPHEKKVYFRSSTEEVFAHSVKHMSPQRVSHLCRLLNSYRHADGKDAMELRTFLGLQPSQDITQQTILQMLRSVSERSAADRD